MKPLFLFLALVFSLVACADEVQLDHTFGPTTQSREALSFSPDARRLAVAGSDGVKIYDARTGKLLETRAGGSFSTACVAWAHDGRTLAAGGMTLGASFRGEIIVWRANGTAKRWMTGEAVVKSLDFSANDGLLASASGGDAGNDRINGAIRLWNVADGKLARTLGTFYGYDASVAFGPKNRVAFGYDGFDDNKRQVMDFVSGRILGQNHDGAEPIFWNDAGDLLPASRSAPIIARETRGDVETRVVLMLMPHPKGNDLFLATLIAQNARTGKRLARLDLGGSLLNAALREDLVALATADGVRVWQIAPDSRFVRPLYTLNRTAAPTQLAVSGDRKTVGVVTNRGLLLLNEQLNVKRLIPQLSSKEALFYPLSFSRDGARLWAGTWLDVSGAKPRRLGVDLNHGDAAPSPEDVNFIRGGAAVPSPDGKLLLEAGDLRDENGKQIPLVAPDPNNGEEPKATKRLKQLLSANWRSDGEQVVIISNTSGGSGSDDGSFVFDKAGRFVRQLRVEGASMYPLDASFSPDGTRIITLTSEEKYEADEKHHRFASRFDVWDARTGILQKTFYARLPAPANSTSLNQLNHFALSPDGQVLAASGSTYNSTTWSFRVLLFDAQSGKQLGALPLSGFLFLPPTWAFLDSKRIVKLSGSALETWDCVTQKRIERRFLVPDGKEIRLVAVPR